MMMLNIEWSQELAEIQRAEAADAALAAEK